MSYGYAKWELFSMKISVATGTATGVMVGLKLVGELGLSWWFVTFPSWGLCPAWLLIYCAFLLRRNP